MHTGQVRLGLSFGGGGTGPDPICEDGTCDPEHQGGVMRNNIIASCSDVGVYINEGKDVVVEHNTLYDTSGIDARFASTTATIRHNVLMGRIRERDGGTATLTNNLDQLSAADFERIFVDPANLDFTLATRDELLDAATGSVVTTDYCGRQRDDVPDLGAVEYSIGPPCDTSTTHPIDDGGSGGGEDAGGNGGEDAGGDAGGGGGADAGDDAGGPTGGGADAGGDPGRGDAGATSPDAGGSASGDDGGGCACANAPGRPASPLGGATLALLAGLLSFSLRRHRPRS